MIPEKLQTAFLRVLAALAMGLFLRVHAADPAPGTRRIQPNDVIFIRVVGEVDLILGRLSSERDFADEVLARWAEARDEEAAAIAFDGLGEELAQARRAQLESQKLDDAIFGHDYEG